VVGYRNLPYAGQDTNAAIEGYHGFLKDFAVSAIVKARLIPDSDVSLNQSPGDCALNPGEEWAGCSCPWAARGNICKHLVKVLLMIRPDVAEGTIARFCGRQVGNVQGGMRHVLDPTMVKDVANTLRQLVVDLSQDVAGDPVLMDHLVAELNQVVGRIRSLKAEIRTGTVHPLVDSPVLQTVNDGRGFSLVRDMDFLERGGKRVSRRL
ncbi:hypothetical protein M758_UG327600, partial [Ceratodon purpureus]